MKKTVWAIDAGSGLCGVCQLLDRRIGHCFNIEYWRVFDRIAELNGSVPSDIIIEDVAPYAMRISQNVIDTCKIIGEFRYRFGTAPFVNSVTFITRSVVRNWVFKTFPDICVPRIIKKMEYTDKRNLSKGLRGLRTKEGNLYAPHFKYVDDRVIIAAMKQLYDIPTPKPGKSNQYGLSDHSWQALAVGSTFLNSQIAV